MSKNIIVQLLEKLNPTLVLMVDKICEDENNQRISKLLQTKIFTDFDKKIFKLGLMQDITKSFSIYTQKNDTLISFEVSGSRKGTLMIKSTIKRESDVYSLNTRLIYAGGYNVQCLHYRVITESSLPKNNSNLELVNNIKLLIKKLTSEQKINSEIKEIEKYIIVFTEKIKTNSEVTDVEILSMRQNYEIMKTYETLTSDFEIYENGFLVFSFENNSKDDYLKLIVKSEKDQISKFKRININIFKNYIRDYQKRIDKLMIKLENL
jgi:hypothetical protein